MKMFSWLTWDYRFSRYISTAKLRGCLHEKTRTGTSFISRWLFYFVSRLHYDWVTSYLKIWRYTWCLLNYTCDSKSQTLCMATCSSLPADRFHNMTGSCFAFTWYCCKILYWSEILTPAWHFVVVSYKQI